MCRFKLAKEDDAEIPSTGGTRGIGAACALALAEAGADVVLAQRPRSSGQDSATHDSVVSTGRHAAIVTCDLGDLSDDGDASVKKCFGKAIDVAKGWGRTGVDILVNCGGIQRRAPSVDFTERDWDEVSRPIVCLPPVLNPAPLLGHRRQPQVDLLTLTGGRTAHDPTGIWQDHQFRILADIPGKSDRAPTSSDD